MQEGKDASGSSVSLSLSVFVGCLEDSASSSDVYGFISLVIAEE